MSVQLKSKDELRLMRESGLLTASILDEMCAAAKPGTSTWDLDQIARSGIARSAKKVDAEVAETAKAIVGELGAGRSIDHLTKTYAELRSIKKSSSTNEIDRIVGHTGDRHRTISAFLGYASPPYPAVVCTSINEVIVHGIPRKDEIIKDGDIIGIDFGLFLHGFCADTARTVMVGNVKPETRKLVETARDALENAIKLCVVDARLGDIGHAVQSYSEARGYSVVRQFVGHGIGRQMHEDPQVPNFTEKGPGTGKRLKSGLVIAVEPMVNVGSPKVEVLDDEWTAVTEDRKLSAHFEHTIAITDEGPWVLTRANSTPGNPGHP